MSVAIETTEDLLLLLKKLGLKVANVEELRTLLMTINTNYNPQAARTRMAKLIGISVPCGLGGIAGMVSVAVAQIANNGALVGAYFVAALAVVWGTTALVSVAALIFSFTLVVGRNPRSEMEKSSVSKPGPLDERVMAALDRDLTV